MEVSEITRRLAVSAFITVLFVAPAVLAQQAGAPPQAQQQQPAAKDPHSAEEWAAQRQALGFLQYLDQGRYADSYAYTSKLIRSKMDNQKFAEEIGKDRAQEGAKEIRKLLDVSYTTTLPGVAPGRYVVLQYSVDFATKKNRVETLTMSYEEGYWRVAGWHVEQAPEQTQRAPPQSQQQPQQQGQPQSPQQQPQQPPQ